ncbi:uncharacterized protein LOC134195271 isoform X2 [Corticium candelabrum]|uniref:uncharacterized protein LOC134195271 isoform X2 n=1 Tax=Corticium candelabrum TaxID=121492 RepID=UPI002E267302|nr:uncharacterized protein LOC134195271 isoform X2 [Corticium candelabrum]
MEILGEISRPKKAHSDDCEWKDDVPDESVEGEEIRSRTRAPHEVKQETNEVNEMEFEDDEEEIGVPPEDDDDEDFYVPSMAQKEKKLKRTKGGGAGAKASQSSKCGRGRKQCPNCQIVVPTCRTQCTECSYQFVVHSSSPAGEGAAAGDGADEQTGTSAVTGATEVQTKTKAGTKKQVVKKKKKEKEGLAGKASKKESTSQFESPSKVPRVQEAEVQDGNAGSGSDSEMASLDQSSIAGSEETRHYFESLATDVENIHQERVGKGYKRCPKCSTVQGSSYAKCPKCDHAFTSKGSKGNVKKEQGKPTSLVRSKLQNGQGRVVGSSINRTDKPAVGGVNGVGSERMSTTFPSHVLRGEESGNQIDVAGLYRQSRKAKRREEQFVQESNRGPILKYGNSLLEQCMADLLQCVPDDSLADLVQAVYNKQLEEYEQVETEMKRTEESYNEVLAMQEEADREIDKATLQANELIVQLAASQQELRQLDKGMMAAVERRQNAKRELERRCLELETLKLRLGEVLGPDYKPNIT